MIQKPDSTAGHFVSEQYFGWILIVLSEERNDMRLRNIPGSREAIEASPYVVREPFLQKGRWKDIFPVPDPLHIEIGMGKGRFLLDMAASHPDINYIGIEMYSSVLLRAVQERERREKEGSSLSNLFFLRFDAAGLPGAFEKGEISRIYLNFSDPWPKERHTDRRLTSRRFLSRYERVLSPDGSVIFKTDNQELFDFSLEQASAAGWIIVSSTRDLHNDPVLMEENVMTEYEERFSSQGVPICRMEIRRS